ncbi:MAG: hypothetical protein WAT09_19145 [Paracoccaceae bacterium]
MTTTIPRPPILAPPARTAQAVHLVRDGADAFIDRVTDALADDHGIAHVGQRWLIA